MKHILSFSFIFLILIVSLTPSAFSQEQTQIRLRIIEAEQTNDNKLKMRLSVIGEDGSAPDVLTPQQLSAQLGGLQPISPEFINPLVLDQLVPLTLMIVVDVTDSMELDVVKNQLPTFVTSMQNLPNARVGLVAFSNEIEGEFPISSDFETAAAFVNQLTRERVPQDSNVVVVGVSAGIDRLVQDNTQGQKALVVVTDAIGTADLSNLGSHADRAKAAHIPIFYISLPNVALGQTVDPSLANFFADKTGGYAYLHEGELTRNGVETSLASNLTNILDVLYTQYEASFDLAAIRDQGLISGENTVLLTLQLDNTQAIDQTTINYLETDYSLTFDGLPADKQVTGLVPLTLITNPILDTSQTYRYVFTANGAPLACAEDSATCQWDTQAPGSAIGLVDIQATIFIGQTPIARGSAIVNVYDANLQVELPEILSGQVLLTAFTSAYSQTAQEVRLYYPKVDGSEGVIIQPLSRDGETQLIWDVENNLFNDPATPESQQIALRVEVWNAVQKTLLARWTKDSIEAVRAPNYILSFEGLPAQLEGNPVIPLNGRFELRAGITPALLAGTKLGLILIDKNDQLTLLAEDNTGTINYVLDTSQYATGSYVLATVLTSSSGITYLQSTPINIYRSLTAVSFSNERENTLNGTTTVTVNAAGFPEAKVVILYTDGTERARSLVSNGQAVLTWDINKTHFSDGSTTPKSEMLRIDVLDEEATILLGRWEELRTLAPSIQYNATLEGLTNGSPLTGIVTLNLLVDPQPNLDSNYRYEFQIGQELLPCSDTTPICQWDTSTLSAGQYSLQAFVLDGNQPIVQTVVTVNLFREDLQVTMPTIISGETNFNIATGAYGGKAQAVRLYATVNGIDRGVVASTPIDSNVAETTLTWDAQASLFADGSLEDSVQVDLRVEIWSENPSVLLARATQLNIEARALPNYELSLSGLPSTSESVLMLDTESKYPLSLALSDPPIAGMEMGLILSDDDGLFEVLQQTNQTSMAFEFDPSKFGPGLYMLTLALVRDGMLVSNTPRISQEINIYRPIVRVSFANESGSYIAGSTKVEVETAGFPADGLVVLYADGVEQTSNTIGRDSITQLDWDIDAIYFANGQEGQLTVPVRVEIRNSQATFVLGLWEETRTLLRRPQFSIQIRNFQDGQLVTNKMPIEADLNPPPIANITYIYSFLAQSTDSGNTVKLIQPDPSQPITELDPIALGLQPGDYELIIAVNQGTQLLLEDRLRFRVVLPLRLGENFRSGALEANELKGEDTLEINNLAGVTRVQIDFKPANQSDFVNVVVAPLDSEAVTSEVKVNWQRKFFESDTSEELPGEVRIRLNDANDQPLYQWQEARILRDNNSIGIWQAIKTIGPFIVLLVVVGIFFNRWVLPRVRDNIQEPTIYGDYVLICRNNGREFDVEYLGAPVIYVGRMNKKVLPWEHEPEINIPDRTVSRKIGKIIMKNSKLTFVAYKDALNILKIKPAGRQRTRLLSEAMDYDKATRSIPIEANDTLVIGAREQCEITLSPPSQIGKSDSKSRN